MHVMLKRSEIIASYIIKGMKTIESTQPNNLVFLVTILNAILNVALLVLVVVLPTEATYLSNISSDLCSEYTILKYQTNENPFKVTVFIFACLSTALSISLTAFFLFKIQKQFLYTCGFEINMTPEDHILCYIGYSSSIMFICIVLGHFLSLIIDAKSCQKQVQTQCKIITPISALILLSFIICWVYHFQKARENHIDDQIETKHIEQITFGKNNPYFASLKQQESIYRPFFQAGRSPAIPQSSHNKKKVAKKVKHELKVMREEIRFYKQQIVQSQEDKQAEAVPHLVSIKEGEKSLLLENVNGRLTSPLFVSNSFEKVEEVSIQEKLKFYNSLNINKKDEKHVLELIGRKYRQIKCPEQAYSEVDKHNQFSEASWFSELDYKHNSQIKENDAKEEELLMIIFAQKVAQLSQPQPRADLFYLRSPIVQPLVPSRSNNASK